jgi:phosphate uptake regulator
MEIRTLLRDAQEIFRKGYESLRYSDRGLANSVLSCQKASADDSGGHPACGYNDCTCMDLLITSISRIRDYAGNIAEFTIDLAQL